MTGPDQAALARSAADSDRTVAAAPPLRPLPAERQMDSPVQRFLAQRWLRPLGWALLAAAMIVSGVCWAISGPVGSSPDEEYHLASIYCPPPVDSSGCVVRKVPIQVGGRTSIQASVQVPSGATDSALCYAMQPTRNADCAARTPDLNSLRFTKRVDVGSYPPLYYHTAHLLTSPDVTSTVVRIRVLNVVLFTLMILALALIAPPNTRRLMAFLIPITAVPLGVFVISSVNPSSWTFTGVLGGWLALHIFFQSDRRRTHILALVVLAVGTVMAVGSRGDGGPYLAVAAVALTIVHYRSVLASRWKAAVPVAMVVVAAVVLLRGGAQTGVATTPGTTTRGSTAGVFRNFIDFPKLVDGMFGHWGVGALGWLDTPMPAITYVGIQIAVGGLILVGLRSIAWPKAAALLLVLLTMVVIPLRTLQALGTTVGNFVQPRYLLPLLPLLVGIALLGANPRTTARFTRPMALVLYTLVVVANFGALYANIRRYVSGTKVTTFNLNDPNGWWWTSGLSPMATWILGSLAFAGVAAPMLITSWRTTAKADAGRLPKDLPTTGTADTSPPQGLADRRVGEIA